MHRKEHEERAQEAFGKPFTEVHVFLDQYFPRYRDLTHRLVLHHRLGIELIGVLMGAEAYQVARQHVLDDMYRLFAGPEELMVLPAFVPGRSEIGRLTEDMETALGHVPDFQGMFALKSKRLKCGCGYDGPMRRMPEPLPYDSEEGSEYVCPWCGRDVFRGQRNPAPVWPDAPGKFDILRELAVGSRFRNGLPEELRKLFF